MNKNILISGESLDSNENSFVHGIDFSEDEMTICGIYACNKELDVIETKNPVTCPRCISGLKYYANIKRIR